MWCIEHRDGWCAVKGNYKPEETVDNVPTVCDYYVVLPFGIKYRTPTCMECKSKIKQYESY